jgi:D-lyxose ketol-isomerase
MISRTTEKTLCREAEKLIEQAGLAFSRDELDSMVVADFGLGKPRQEGLQVLTFIDTKFIGAKAIVLLPGQTMVEHWHPARGSDPGKEETLRCLYGSCRVYVPGESISVNGFVPSGKEEYYTCRKEFILNPTEQYTFSPGTPHWFQPGDEGTVVLSISTKVTDLDDCFTNPLVVRQTVYSE